MERRKQLERFITYTVLQKPSVVYDYDYPKVSFSNGTYARIVETIIKAGGQIDLLGVEKESGVGIMEIVDILTNTPLSDTLSTASAFRELLEMQENNKNAEALTTALHAIQNKGDALKAFDDVNKRMIELLPKSEDGEAKEEIEKIIETIDAFEKAKKDNGFGLIGTSWGYDSFDKATDGIRPGQLITIGGRSSMGKTTVSINILKNLIKQNKRCLFFSIEMVKSSVYMRLASIVSGEETNKIEKGFIKKEKRDKILNAIGEKPLKIVDTHVMDWLDIKAEIMRDKAQHGTEFVFIDYLQLMSYGNKKDIDKIDSIIIDMASFATQQGITIFLVSQMANDHFQDIKDIMQTVPKYRGSGLIFQRSNVALEVVTELKFDHISKLREDNLPIPKIVIMHKDRDGGIGHLYCLEHYRNGRMEEVTRNEYEDAKQAAIDESESPGFRKLKEAINDDDNEF